MALMSCHRFWERVRSGRAIMCDGAMGSELIRLGVPAEGVLGANVRRRPLVRDIHSAYIDAGAEMITSNTFGLLNSSDWTNEITSGVDIALDAARTSISEIGVWLSLTGVEMHWKQEKLQLLSLSMPQWPEMLLIETCASLDEALTALRTIALVRHEVLAISAHFGPGGCMLDGTPPEVFAAAAVREGAQIVGANCGVLPEHFIEITARMRSTTNAPLLVQPSAGLPERDAAGDWIYPVDPKRFADVARRLMEAGANIIGGCCGTSHAHISAACAQVAPCRPH